jgi:hypothetical protein
VNHPQTDLPPTTDDPLPALTEDFPQFGIEREVTADGRTHYIARSLLPNVHPHTVVSEDPDELRAMLTEGTSQPLNAGVPSIARVYDRWLGGKDNFAADRAVADGLSEEFPEIADMARANRQFVIRAVRHVAAVGITQFIDIGTGLPVSPSIDETVHQLQPTASVAYVDNDPVVLVHARAMLGSHRGVVVLAGDMRRPEEILGSTGLRAMIDLRQPVCIVLASMLHFVTPDEADAIVATLIYAMAPGSYLIVSSGTATGTDPNLIVRLADAYQDTAVISGRSEAEIAAYFAGLELLSPGLVDVWAWRSDAPKSPRLATGSARMIGAVGRKPADWRVNPDDVA